MNSASMSPRRSLAQKLRLGSSRTGGHRNSGNRPVRQPRRFVPMLEKCEDRISPALTFNFTISDNLNLFGGRQAQMMTDLQAAGTIWGQYLNGVAPINVNVIPDRTVGLATAGPTDFTPLNRQQGGFNVTEDGALNKARTGNPNRNGNPFDINISINPTVAQTSIYYDPSGVARTGQVPSNQSDFISLVLHELGHGLGFITQRTTSGPGTGTFPNGQMDTFGALSVFGTGGILNFTGPQAQAVFGGPVPLTSEGPTGLSNFTHLGQSNPPVPTSLGSELMRPALVDGTKYYVSRLDVAILADINWPL